MDPSGRSSNTASTDGPIPPRGTIEIHIGTHELVIRKRYEVISIINDLLVGIWFLIGSFLFFSDTTVTVGTWLFVIGSAELLIRPVIRLVRHLHIGRIAEATPGPESSQDF